MIPSSTKPMKTPMLCFVWSWRTWAHSDGNCLHTIGVATMKPAHQRKHTAFTWMKCLPIAVMRTKYTLYQQWKLLRPNGLMHSCSNWSRIGDQTHWKHDMCMQRWLAGYPQATPSAHSQVVSSLSATPWTYTSQRDDECCNVLERRYAYHHPVNNKVMQILPD